MEKHQKRMAHLFSKLYFLLRKWKEVAFLEGPWCGETAVSNAFPTLFNLVVHKDARVADVWDSSREDGGWSPVFLRHFND